LALEEAVGACCPDTSEDNDVGVCNAVAAPFVPVGNALVLVTPLPEPEVLAVAAPPLPEFVTPISPSYPAWMGPPQTVVYLGPEHLGS